MTIQNQDTQFPVYFGYSDAGKHPTEAIAGVRQVILAMNDMQYNYRGPNDLGVDPDSDTRSGINFIFKACAMQLQSATQEIEAQDAAPTYPRFQLDPTETDVPVRDRMIAAGLAIGLTDQEMCEELGMGWATMLESCSRLKQSGMIPTEIAMKPDMSEDAKSQFTITEPVEPSTERQSA